MIASHLSRLPEAQQLMVTMDDQHGGPLKNYVSGSSGHKVLTGTLALLNTFFVSSGYICIVTISLMKHLIKRVIQSNGGATCLQPVKFRFYFL
jgi:hypothetical protein